MDFSEYIPVLQFGGEYDPHKNVSVSCYVLYKSDRQTILFETADYIQHPHDITKDQAINFALYMGLYHCFELRYDDILVDIADETLLKELQMKEDKEMRKKYRPIYNLLEDNLTKNVKMQYIESEKIGSRVDELLKECYEKKEALFRDLR